MQMAILSNVSNNSGFIVESQKALFNFRIMQENKSALDKAYDASRVEDKIYQQWEKSGYFTPKVDPKKKPFVISMPPPNATGQLHLGHAVMLAIQDIMTRYHRMKGDSTLWLPGTDHAAIATQNRVEKMIAEEGLTRHSMGRTKFLQRVKEFVADSQDTIRNQVRKMGASCDWTRERYTLDAGLSEAVETVFIKMYKDGLIYRGNRIVNWCIRCHSTLADDEVEYKEEKTAFYYFKFGPFSIGTVRPETKLQDKVVIVHPQDKRYKKWHHKKMMIPWIDGEVEMYVIPDEAADMEMGSGAMTITPAHSFVDFELAQKYQVPIFNIIGEDGLLTEKAGQFAGMQVRDARHEFVKILQKKGLVEKIDENYVHNVSVCYRCGTPIEPLVSKQWFIDVNKKVIPQGTKKISLKQASIDVVKKKKIEIVPERFNKTYFHWMENLHDWCVSRQIWWGHRIPAWYSKSGDIKVQKDKPVETAKSGKWKQDPDTLDTWFSSALWTFSTLGWPQKTKDLEYFHPTSVLETGHDILFFWVARMIIMSMYAMHEVPFKTVYLHGILTDKHGRKMSKSLGNGIDPLDMIAKYGTDAVRLSLIIGSTPGNSMSIYEEKIGGYRNFVNKIWNAARFALMNLEAKDLQVEFNAKQIKTKADKWILTRLQQLIKEVTEDIEKYRFSDGGTKIYNFTWGEYCDWYLEMSKGEMISRPVLKYVLENLLILLHPFTPYVTEVLWKKLKKKNLLMIEPWPKANAKLIFAKESNEIELVKIIINRIRSAKKEMKIDPVRKINAVVYSAHAKILQEYEEAIMRMARLESLTISKDGPKVHNAISIFYKDTKVYLPMEGILDLKLELQRLQKEIDNKQNLITSIDAKLNNKGFLAGARKELIIKEKERKQHIASELEQLLQKISEIQT